MPFALLLGLLAASPVAPEGEAARPSVASASATPPARPTRNATENLGLGALGAGAALGIVSAASLVIGLDIERSLRAEIHDRATADALMGQRAAAGFVAWPSAILAAAGIATGVTLLALDDAPGAEEVSR
jgi:hypothetical protein